MQTKPKLLDAFCCEGGASMGFHRAGFDVFGVDLFRHRDTNGKLKGFRQQRYPFPSHQGDAIEFITEHGHEYDVIAASPPCQLYSVSANAHKANHHPDLVGPTRDAILATGKPYIIENVPGAPLLDPVMLCGTMFDLRATDTDGLRVWLKRHRLFESNVFLVPPGGCFHPKDILCAGVYGNGSPSRDAAKARADGYTPPSQTVRNDLMGIDWMSRNGLSQSIPPIYTEFLGKQMMAHLKVTC